jgi:hypothetical protein
VSFGGSRLRFKPSQTSASSELAAPQGSFLRRRP